MDQSISLDDLLDKIDLEDYLDLYGIDYKTAPSGAGNQLILKECPVCGSEKWKVYLNAETALGNCFAGDHPPDEHFNLWIFAKEYQGLEKGYEVFSHLKDVARQLGWQPPKKKKAVSGVVSSELKLPYSFPLPIEGQNLVYLANRGISKDVAKHFDLRFCQTGEFSFIKDGEKKAQSFRNRIIFPIYNLEGELASFQGRDITGQQDPKYKFPFGFPATGRYLYNGHNALGAEHVLMGEGVFDVMAIKVALDSDAGLRDVVPIGSFGKHLSRNGGGDIPDQLGAFMTLKKSGLRTVTFMWDSEKGAIKSAIEAGSLLKTLGFVVRIALLPPGKDPNEVTKEEVLRAYYRALTLNPKSMMRLSMGLVK